MSSLRSFTRRGFFALMLSIIPLAGFAVDDNKTDLDYSAASDEARVERSETDPTYLMDDSPQRRRMQAEMKEKRRKAKQEKELEATQEAIKAQKEREAKP